MYWTKNFPLILWLLCLFEIYPLFSGQNGHLCVLPCFWLFLQNSNFPRLVAQHSHFNNVWILGVLPGTSIAKFFWMLVRNDFNQFENKYVWKSFKYVGLTHIQCKPSIRLFGDDKSIIKGGLIPERFFHWLKSPNKGPKSLSWALSTQREDTQEGSHSG